jgi:uncharacterized protein YbjT (DUF2867 family)
MTTKNDRNIILVTGAAGNVGTELVKQLSTAGAIFRAGVHSNKSADKIGKISSRAQLIEMDYDKPETLRRACDGVSKIFLLTPDSPRAVELASNFVKVAKKAEVKHIVKQSNILVTEIESTTTPYARQHREAEKIIDESGIQFTFLRPNDFMQNFVNFYAPTIKTNNAFYIPGGDAKVSFVDVRDVAAVAAKVLTEHDESESRHFGKAYDITGPEPLSFYQAAEILSNTAGKKVNYVNIVNIPEADARRGMRAMGMNESFINTALELFDNYRKGYASRVSDAVESITGNKPISFAQFAMDYAGAFR